VVKNKFNQGFTLVELMVTLAVAAIILAIAAPSFSQMIRDHRLITTANDFMGTMQLARSEAIRRGVQVTMLPITQGDWSSGWNVFTDWNGNESIGEVGAVCAENQDCFLSQQNILDAVTSVAAGNTGSGFRFMPTGEILSTLGFPNGNITFCSTGSNERIVTLNQSGSTRISIGNVCP
jgi:type IV fimbrial biogenesis protein FimT